MKERWRDVLGQFFFFITLLGAVNFYLFVVLGAFCVATGRVNRQKAVLVLKVLRGQITGEPPPAQIAVTPEERDAIRERIRQEIERELTTRRREAESILSRAGQIRADLEAERKMTLEATKALAERRAAFDTALQTEAQRKSSAEFAQNVKWFSTIEPAEGARILAEMPLGDVLRYLRALKDRTATELIVALAAEYERRDALDGTDLALEFRREVAKLPAAADAGIVDTTAPAGGTPPR
ncbi:MAG: hypothetical protein HYY93_16170 [Planctomycetes bacterium]|nr:hypothetical protein [Planctomycetota bacterium]